MKNYFSRTSNCTRRKYICECAFDFEFTWYIIYYDVPHIYEINKLNTTIIKELFWWDIC